MGLRCWSLGWALLGSGGVGGWRGVARWKVDVGECEFCEFREGVRRC